MKKFLLALLITLVLGGINNSYAAYKKVYTSWSQGEVVTMSSSTGEHNSKLCESCNGAWHCVICHVNHSTNGDYDRAPKCDCNSKFTKDTVPSGYKKVGTGSIQIQHSCSNLSGMQQQRIYCTWYYDEYEKVASCGGQHPVRCIVHGKTQNEHPVEGYQWRASNPTTTCQECGKTVYKGSCTKTTPPSCSHSTVCSLHGKTAGQHPYDGYRWAGSVTSSSKCSSCNTYLTIGECTKSSCNHTILCSLHKKTAGQHPYNGYSWTGTKLSSTTKCSQCGELLIVGICQKTSEVGDGGDPDPDPGYYPDPDPPCSHDNTYRVEYSPSSETRGSQATTNSVPFRSEIDTTETYRKSNPYNVNSTFTLSGNGHIKGDVEHTPKTTQEPRTAGYEVYCSDCGEKISDNTYTTYITITDWTATTPKFTDTYHNVIFSFTGFEVNGKKTITYTPSSKQKEGSVPARDSSFSEPYVITKLNPTNLNEDASGLLYGYVYAKCSCGCKTNSYKIYFDLTPPQPPVSEMYTLTVKAEGAPITGGVKIYGDDDYSDFAQKNSPVGWDFIIYAKANTGYKFIGWYKEDGRKYSENGDGLTVDMPGYNFTLIAKFEKEDTGYHISAYSDGNGTVTIGDETGWEVTANVPEGGNVEIVANADENFIVDYWECINNPSIELGEDEIVQLNDISDDYIIYVHFKPIEDDGKYRKLTTSASGPGYAIGGTDYAIVGEEYPVWAIPHENASFRWWKNKTTNNVLDLDRCDVIIMPDKNYYIVACFKEDKTPPTIIVEEEKYHLSIKVEGGGKATGSGDYFPEERVNIKATPNSGYEFVGWYEDNLLVSTEEVPNIRMPYYDMTLTAVFKKQTENSNSPFRILSIRDIRWQDYFSGGDNSLYIPSDAKNNTILVGSARLINKAYDKYRDIVYGYAVEFELTTEGIYKNDSTLVVTPTIYERTSTGRLEKLVINLGDYAEIDSSNKNDVDMFMIKSTENKKVVNASLNIINPEVKWTWVYYLPTDLYERIYKEIGRNSDVVIKFDIKVKANGKSFDYIKSINFLNRTQWDGNVYTYDMSRTVLDDIYDNATN